jgi:2-methylcitrate dehydratase PrpD
VNAPVRTAGATRALVAAVRGITWDSVPDDAREVARHCLLDFLGCAVAGSREPLTEILIDTLARAEGGSQATLIGRRERATLATAALVNGAAGHALDFDDTHMVMTGHPTVPVLPALLGLAEQERTDGRRLLAALVAGIELECRLAAMLGPRHYAIGFHATGTLGTFGAAAACAHLLALDEDGWLHALGLAGTQAAGLKSGFGTMAKPLHAGRAASAGLVSALLAHGGFTANPEIVETEQGFAATHAGDPPAVEALERHAGRFLVRDTLFKYHAACYLTHSAIEASLRLREEHRVPLDSISRIELRVAPELLGVCAIPEPRTGLEGKFSLRATTAMALLGDDTGDPATFTDARVGDPELVALRDRVRVETVPGLVITRARVTIHSGSGRIEAEADSGVPATDLAKQQERLLRKFRALVAPVLGDARADELAAKALGADELSSAAEISRAAALER